MIRSTAAALVLVCLSAATIASAAQPAWISNDAAAKWIGGSGHTLAPADDSSQAAEPSDGERSSAERQVSADAPGVVPVSATAVTSNCCDGPLPCDGLHCDDVGCDGSCGATHDGKCLLLSDQPLLHKLRNRKLFGDVKYSVGGGMRYRYMNEINRLRPLGETRRNTYDLWRVTPFLEVGNDWVKGYVQAIDAASFGEDLPMLPIDENRADLLQYYIDAKLLELDGGDVRGQYGRMFLKYGDELFVSPLPWANTFRNFQGGRLYYSSETWDVDAFVVRPLNGAASASTYQPSSFDNPDQSVVFSGVYTSYKKAKNGKFDVFWLWNDESEPRANRQDGSRHTIGARYAGSYAEKSAGSVVRTWTWDTMGAWQFGEDTFVSGGAGQNVNAGAFSSIGTVTLNELPWSPSFKGLFWWGSGDSNPTDGTVNTLTTLYPFGHNYWGLIDNFNGANLLDYSLQASIKPVKKLKLGAQWHWFDKANANDFVYNIAGAPLGNTTTGSRNIGQELDLLATYAVNANLSVQLGYFWFWYGDAIDNNAGIATRDDAEQVYLMATWGF